MECADFFKGVAGGDAVNEEEAFACAHVLLAHCSIFFLTCCVQNVQQSDLFVDQALLAIRVFDSRIILINEMTLNELNSKS